MPASPSSGALPQTAQLPLALPPKNVEQSWSSSRPILQKSKPSKAVVMPGGVFPPGTHPQAQCLRLPAPGPRPSHPCDGSSCCGCGL